MQAIASIMETDFKKKRLSLLGLYLLIVGSVIVLFSVLIVYQSRDSFSDPSVRVGKDIVVTRADAEAIVRELRPAGDIGETEYEIENNRLYYTLTFTDESEIKVDLFTGEAYIPEDDTGFFMNLSDDFEEKVVWIGLLVFLLSATLSVYVINKTLDPIARNIQKQKQFVSGAAHELRNPLSALHARIESALLSDEPELKKEVLEDLLGETKRLIAVSEGLLSLERGELRVRNIVTLSPEKSISRTIQRLEPIRDRKNITIEKSADATLVSLDEEDLESLLYNLLHNAIKFTSGGGTVRVLWSQGTLTVSDTGKGIPNESLPYIFDRFYKADASRTNEGSGLGLSLVKDIVERYKATIDVSSTVDVGTTVSIRFA